MRMQLVHMKQSILLLAAFNAIRGTVTAWQDGEESFLTQGCIDSKIQFPVWKSMRACADAEKNGKKCKLHAFKRYCPVTCDSCPDTCEDQPFCTSKPDADKLCKKYWFARDCAVTCNFCPALVPTAAPSLERGFVKIDEREGLFEDSHLGVALTMSSDGKSIFVAGTNTEKGRVDILEYSGVENTLGPIGVDLDARNKLVLDTSSDGKNLAVAYRMFDEDKLGKVEVYRNQNAVWDKKIVFYANSTAYGDYKFGQALRISDDGKILLIAMKSSVRVFDFDALDWRPNVPVPGLIADASMTSDGNTVAVSTTVRSSIRVYKWSNGNWTQHGNEIAPLYGEALGLFNYVRIVDDGETVFAASSRLFSLRGAIRVFDLQVGSTDTERIWKSRDRLVIKGLANDARLGRELSISRDGKFVAWASNNKVGALQWNGYNWQDQGVLLKTRNPMISMDPEGNYLAVGLPKAKSELSDAGKIYVYKHDILGQSSTSPSATPSIAPTPLPSTTQSGLPSKLPSPGPSHQPSLEPTSIPSNLPSMRPSATPSAIPTGSPSLVPTRVPSDFPLSPPTFVEITDIQYTYLVEVNGTIYNNSTVMEEILFHIITGIVSNATRCEDIPETSTGGRRLIKGAQKKESKLISSHHKNSEMRKRWKQRGLFDTDNDCIPFVLTNLSVALFTFDCLPPPQNAGFECALISLDVSIARLDGSMISVDEAEAARNKVSSALNQGSTNGVLKELFYT